MPTDTEQGHTAAPTAPDDQEDDFSIRAWMRRRGLSLPVDDPDVRAEVTALLRRDFTKRVDGG